jgi:hypothetical protein
VLPSALFVGDSIVREVHERYKLISPSSKVKLLLEWKFQYDQVQRFANMAHTQKYDILFIGGNAIHILAKRPGPMDGTQAKTMDPIDFHRKLAREVLRTMSEIQKRGQKVVYVGAMTTEQQMFLTPAKKDWDVFHDFSLLKAWAVVDREETRRHGIPLLDVAALASQCPGLKCDGMHFASQFKSYDCCSSAQLYDRLLIAFLGPCYYTAIGCCTPPNPPVTPPVSMSKNRLSERRDIINKVRENFEIPVTGLSKEGRCGPKFGDIKCTASLPYCSRDCSERNGWCGISDAHKNAQASNMFNYVKS